MIDFGRDICSDLAQGESREWLVTNGIGGFASGTISGLLTRRYHGLLIAALNPPVSRTLLLTKLDEMVEYQAVNNALFSNRWSGGVVEPDGYKRLERFYLDGTTPVWHFAFRDALLEKRIWMQPGQNTTYIQYRLLRGNDPVTIRAKAMINYRDFHSETRSNEWQMEITEVDAGLKVSAYAGATSFYLLSPTAHAEKNHDWNTRFFLVREANRGLTAVDDNLQAGTFEGTLDVGESMLIVASTEADPLLDVDEATTIKQRQEEVLEEKAGDLPQELRHLVLAADQFVVRRRVAREPNGASIIAGYHWFSDWGRDTMIALPGLTLATGRYDVAAKILRTFAHYVDRGMLPNRFPDAGETPEYNTADATLWYLEALRAYHATTGDQSLVAQLFPTLTSIIAWHLKGTRYNIQVDESDGLLFAGEEGVQLTWMDAKVDDWVVTPRIGKAVEINALWYNGLRIMARFADLLGTHPVDYAELADHAQRGFERFWNEDKGFCYDVIDVPDEGGPRNDPQLRPNQLLAVSLHHSPLSAERQKAVVDICARYLLTSYGLRSLGPEEASYSGSYGGSPRQRDSVYHQGTVWSWLIGPFVEAHYRVYGDATTARSFLHPLLKQCENHGLGSISEIFDGNRPFQPRGAIAQAWSVAEVLRAWTSTAGE